MTRLSEGKQDERDQLLKNNSLAKALFLLVESGIVPEDDHALFLLVDSGNMPEDEPPLRDLYW